MKYVLMELQTFEGGSVSVVPPVAYDTRREAEAAWHTALAAAARSGLPRHSAVIVTSEGEVCCSQCYKGQ